LLAAHGERATQLEELQYMVGEGPGEDSFLCGGPVCISDLAGHGGRWPGFTSAALDADVGAVFAFPLLVGTMRFGTPTASPAAA
jgi:hypothetical protein